MAMKVWGGCFDGTTRHIVAAKTKKAAAEALGVTLYSLNGWAAETGNDLELATALAEPGVVFSAPASGPHSGTYVRGKARYVRGGGWPLA